METQLINLGNGFYADDKDDMYFRPAEFLRSNGLPVKKRLMRMVLEEVQHLDPGIHIMEDRPSGLLD